LESRRLFYRLERRLRGIKLNERHRHSYLVEKLYTAYLENERLSEVMAVNALSRSAIVSHPRVDIGSEQDSVMKILHEIKACVPYLTKGKTLKDSLEEERQRTIEEYKAYVRSRFETEEEYQEFMRKRANG